MKVLTATEDECRYAKELWQTLQLFETSPHPRVRELNSILALKTWQTFREPLVLLCQSSFVLPNAKAESYIQKLFDGLLNSLPMELTFNARTLIGKP